MTALYRKNPHDNEVGYDFEELAHHEVTNHPQLFKDIANWKCEKAVPQDWSSERKSINIDPRNFPIQLSSYHQPFPFIDDTNQLIRISPFVYDINGGRCAQFEHRKLSSKWHR